MVGKACSLACSGTSHFPEEDASAEITAFGNELLFARVLRNIIINGLESCV